MMPKTKIARLFLILPLFLTLFLVMAALGYPFLVRNHARHSPWIHTGIDENGRLIWKEPAGNCMDVSFSRDADNDGVANEIEAVKHGHEMINTPFDLLMGRHDNLLGKAGFVVCVDVPTRSYLRSGVAMPGLLKKCSKEHPEWFHIDQTNNPSSEFFYRRVRNYYDLFKHHPNLEAGNQPKPGDWIFYGRFHTALVDSVDADGNYKAVEACLENGRVAVRNRKRLEMFHGKPDFFGRIKYRSN